MADEVKVSLKNHQGLISVGANVWALSLCDWNVRDWVEGSAYINDTITLAIPTRRPWTWPARFRVIIAQYNYATGSGIYLYLMQSVSPEAAVEGWQYVEEYIPKAGEYFYNVTTAKFEGEAPPLPEAEFTNLVVSFRKEA